MEHHTFRQNILIGFTFLLGIILTILPLPKWVEWYQPAWVFMILLFWMIFVPYRVGIGTAFIIGLLLDLVTGTILGQHALIFSCLSYFFIRFQIFIRSFSIWQETILVLVTTAIYFALQYWIMAMVSFSLLSRKYWLTLVSTTFLWPWLRFLLNSCRHRLKLV